MKSSPSINELAAALAKAQSEINPAFKSSTNPYFKSGYADLEAVWETCRPHLAKHGLAVTQILYIHESGGVRLETIVLHSSGQWISGELPVEPVKKDPQGMGSAITYMRRYGLQSTLCLVARGEDDDGNYASEQHKPPMKKPGALPPELPSKPQVNNPGDWVVNSGEYSGKKLSDIPDAKLMRYIQYIKDYAVNNKQEITGPFAQFIEKAEAYLGKKFDEEVSNEKTRT